MARVKWKSKIGFYLVAIGSAFGLGSLWRFPYMVADNGGGGFVWLYLGLVFVIGMPLLVGEILFGKISKSSMISGLRQLKGKDVNHPFGRFLLKIPYVGLFGLFVSSGLLAYYSVVCGWVLHFLMQFAVKSILSQPFDPVGSLSALQENGILQLSLTSVHILLVTVMVAKGVEEGIEYWISQLMPLFIILLFLLTMNSISMTSNSEALRYLLYPDFSQLKLSSLGDALGHVLFTLSVGFGTMVTFGSYLRKKVFVPGAGFRVATLDSLTAIFAGLIIFPLLIASPVPEKGADLLFQAVPDLLSRMPGGVVFGVAFFLCLYLAALGASIGIMETMVANVKDVRSQIPRNKIAVMLGGMCFGMAIIPALSSSELKDIVIGGRSVFEFIDHIFVNWFVPLLALVVSQIVAYSLSPSVKKSEFALGEVANHEMLYKHWQFVMRVLIPLIFIVSFVLQIIALL